MAPTDVKTPIDKSETTSEAKIEILKPSQEKAQDASYSVESEGIEKEATVFEKVKGFLFGKSKKEKATTANIKPSEEIATPVEISSELELKQVSELSKEDIVKGIATDTFMGQDAQEIAVSF